MRCTYLFKLVFLFFWGDIYPGVELRGHMVVVFLVFWETSVLFSTVAAPIYIPTNSVWVFPFIHILANICNLCSFWSWPFWQAWGDISLWFWFAFPWLLVMLSFSSCVCWPFAFPLWKNVYSVLLPIFKSGLFFWCWVVWAIYICWILIPYQSYYLQIGAYIVLHG